MKILIIISMNKHLKLYAYKYPSFNKIKQLIYSRGFINLFDLYY